MLAFILIAAHHDTPGCLTAVAFIKTAKCQLCTSKHLLTPELMPHLSLLGFQKPSKNAKSEHPANHILRVISVKPWNPQKHRSFLEKPLSKGQKQTNPTPKKPHLNTRNGENRPLAPKLSAYQSNTNVCVFPVWTRRGFLLCCPRIT